MNTKRLSWMLILSGFQALAKTNQSVYEDPFDLGGGGSTLTWATQEGMLATNPALLPWGGKFFRWLGLKSTIAPGKSSIDQAQSLAQGGGLAGSTAAEGEQSDAQADENQAFVDGLFNSPLHLGYSQALSFITEKGGISAFTSIEPDLKAWKRGDPSKGAGTPSIVARNETYAGLLTSVAQKSALPHLSFGMTAKYLLVNETEIIIDLADQEAINNLQTDITGNQSPFSAHQGIGFDLGSLYFLQGEHLDYRLAYATHNVGGLTLGPKEFKQTHNVGIGLTFHTQADAIHLSADLRDATNAYEEELFKRVYLGCKLMMRQLLGVSLGVYHGYPSFGAEVDLLVMRIAAAYYTREYGARPGVDQRSIYLLSGSWGFDF